MAIHFPHRPGKPIQQKASRPPIQPGVDLSSAAGFLPTAPLPVSAVWTAALFARVLHKQETPPPPATRSYLKAGRLGRSSFIWVGNFAKASEIKKSEHSANMDDGVTCLPNNIGNVPTKIEDTIPDFVAELQTSAPRFLLLATA
jgi:hypothetical protein